MKKLTFFLIFLLLAGQAFAAGPVSEEGNVIYFNATDQETTTKFRVRAVVWTSDQGTDLDIAADDDFLLEDGTGQRIVGKRAEGAGDGLEISFGDKGVLAHGLKAEDLDGGVLYVIGDRY